MLRNKPIKINLFSTSEQELRHFISWLNATSRSTNPTGIPLNKPLPRVSNNMLPRGAILLPAFSPSSVINKSEVEILSLFSVFALGHV